MHNLQFRWGDDAAAGEVVYLKFGVHVFDAQRMQTCFFVKQKLVDIPIFNDVKYLGLMLLQLKEQVNLSVIKPKITPQSAFQFLARCAGLIQF